MRMRKLLLPPRLLSTSSRWTSKSGLIKDESLLGGGGAADWQPLVYHKRTKSESFGTTWKRERREKSNMLEIPRCAAYHPQRLTFSRKAVKIWISKGAAKIPPLLKNVKGRWTKLIHCVCAVLGNEMQQGCSSSSFSFIFIASPKGQNPFR